MARVKKLAELTQQERSTYDRARMRIANYEQDLAPWKGEVVLFVATKPAEDGENVHEGWRSIPRALAELDKWARDGWHVRLKLLPHGNQVAVPINPDELRHIHNHCVAVQKKIADLRDVRAALIKI